VWPGAHVWPFIWTSVPLDRRRRPEKPPKINRALDFERNRIAVVMIRLARFGARKQPYYRIVAIEKDRARNGRSIEVVGTYNPRTNPATVDLKYDRITYWRSVGAQFSDIVEKLVAKNPVKAVEAPLTPSSPVKAAVVAPAPAVVEAPVVAVVAAPAAAVVEAPIESEAAVQA
jgi:small subunit ribosomal protein S16